MVVVGRWRGVVVLYVAVYTSVFVRRGCQAVVVSLVGWYVVGVGAWVVKCGSVAFGLVMVSCVR